MRYQQLAIGICVSVATSYGCNLVNPYYLAPAIAQTTSDLSNTIKLNSIRPTNNGLMLTVNANPEIRVQREDNPDRLIVDLQNTTLVKELHQTSLLMNRFGVRQVRIAQFQNNPAIARLVFDLDSNDPNSKVAWQSQYIAATNTLLLTPANQVTTSPIRPSLPIPVSSNPANIARPAAIQRLSFSSTGQLVIEASQPVNYQTNLDRASGIFNVTVANANISPNLQRPTLAANSPIERIRLSQVGNSVEIGIKTLTGWQISEAQRQNDQQIKLQVALNSVSQLPQNSPKPLPNNSPSTPSPQNIGDRRRGVVLVDAGHGGRDPGAVANGVREKDIVLPISLILGQSLQSMGYTVYYTRTNDVEIDLEPRVALAERVNADVFVSIHANSLASLNSAVNGVETFHARGSTLGRELASYVQSQIIASTGANDRNAKAAGFYVLARTSMPAILVETGFVTNPREAANLSDPNYQKRMAEAIAKGIDQFMRVRR
ncbi:N-acetylmuramoyl-L-alanine amidase [Pseudanabaena sp. ABRG5-3]|uniref:N-acetylmuramoyl-L-alanine amidase n=1 Tax=Pseudanabaena sp. ABRG5-3 TaxID=685565 RepID=UPI000DC6DFE3|nr:N-acetylmuramoyl-L-alanine amidase [Pseudanabaena sp. ABRG5-3]BBC23012.1 N-acetylmuramoyl-L-alanine amidase [Pseudanabaena sp. ABRG5-3]